MNIVNLVPTEVRSKLDHEQIVLVDVRTPQEFAFERILGALLFPLSTFDAKFLPSQVFKPIVFYCGTGKRSARAAAIYDQEFSGASIAHMEGGLGAWKQEKFPLITVNPADGSEKKIIH